MGQKNERGERTGGARGSRISEPENNYLLSLPPQPILLLRKKNPDHSHTHTEKKKKNRAK